MCDTTAIIAKARNMNSDAESVKYLNGVIKLLKHDMEWALHRVRYLEWEGQVAELEAEIDRIEKGNLPHMDDDDDGDDGQPDEWQEWHDYDPDC